MANPFDDLKSKEEVKTPAPSDVQNTAFSAPNPQQASNGGDFSALFQPPSGLFNQQNQQSVPAQNSAQKQQYNIIDLYWFLNQKLSNPKTLSPGECHLLTIGYNASYGNLRLTFYNVNDNAITNSSIVLASTTRLAISNLYPETCSELLFNRENGKVFRSYERVIKQDSSWSPNETILVWNKDLIGVQTTVNKNNVVFTIAGWQISAFENALGFMTSGSAWISNLLNNALK